MNTKKYLTFFVLLMVAVLLSACATLDVGIETTNSPDHALVDTAVAETLEAAQQVTIPVATTTPEPTIGNTPQSSTTPEAAITATPLPTPSSAFAGLLYRLGDQLFRIDSDGGEVPLTPGLDPQFLPNQFTPRAAFSSDGKYMISWWDFSDLWLVDLISGQSQNLTQTPDRVEYSAQFWPGRPDTIIFMSQPVDNQGPSAGYLSTIRLDGSGYRVLDDTASSIGLPALSSDGQTIAYDRGGEAWLYRWDSSSEVLNLAKYQVNDSLKIANPAWSPTGKYLAWMATIDPGSSNSHAGLALFNVEANNYRLLHTFQSAGRDGWYNPPVWSLDGTWLVIFDESQTQPGVWVTHPDGSGDTLVYAASSSRSVRGLQVMWSADSKRLLVIDPNAEGGLRLDLIDIYTGQKAILPLPAGAFPLAWTQAIVTVTPTPGQGTITQPDLPSQPVVSILPTSGPSGTMVQVAASGFPVNTSVSVGLGPANSEFGEVGLGTTDASGFFTLQVPIQGEAGMDWIFSVYTGDAQAVSTPFRVTSDVPAAILTVSPLSMQTLTPNMDMWTTYTSLAYAISLQHPGNWQPVSGYGSPETGETRFAAINGFF